VEERGGDGGARSIGCSASASGPVGDAQAVQQIVSRVAARRDIGFAASATGSVLGDEKSSATVR